MANGAEDFELGATFGEGVPDLLDIPPSQGPFETLTSFPEALPAPSLLDTMSGFGADAWQGLRNLNLRDWLTLATLGLGGGGVLGALLGGGGTTQRQQTRTGAPSSAEAQATAQALADAQRASSLYQALIGQLMGGQLVTPEVEALVKASYGNVIRDIIDTSLEDAARRGWPGGQDVLGSAGANVYNRLLSQLPGQMAQSRLQLALGIPQLAGTLAGGLGQTSALSGNLATALSRTRDQTATATTTPPFLQQLAPLLQGTGQTLAALNYPQRGFGG